ncbi:MAG: molybdopterin-dependent oxidoreductase, partial [Rhodospirillales bacterium]
YGNTKKSFIRLGYGFTRSRNGAANMHAVSCLPAVSGAWKEKGGGALFANSTIYKLDKTLIEGLDLDDPPRTIDMNRIGAVLTGDEDALFGGGPVSAMLIQNTNPLSVAPDTLRVRKGFERDDLFVCVHEQFMTETAAKADIVLPATTFLEHDDIYLGGGHTFMQVAKKVIEPYAGSRSNHQVISALAERLGAGHPGFSMTAWQIIEATLEASGYPDADSIYQSGGLDCALPFDEAHFLDGFPTPSGRFRFAPDWAGLGDDHGVMPELPGHMDVIDKADADRPFRMVTAPAHDFLNTTFNETDTSREKEGRPTVLIHPEDCAELDIADGAMVRLGNRQGSVMVHARHFEGLQRGVIVVETIWPDASYVEGVGINVLTSSDVVAPAGGAAFHDTAVWVRNGQSD